MNGDMRLYARRRRGTAWAAGVVALLFLILAGCGGEQTSTPSVSSTPAASSTPPSSQETQPSSAARTPLPTRLVGYWTTYSTNGSQRIKRQYVFTADGRYAYGIGTCQSSMTDCSLVSQEQGYAQVVNGNLSLRPQTEPNDGARTWPYRVIRDPNVHDLQLHITLPDGQDDIFYFGSD